MSLDDLHPDPNYPGLRVCNEDTDEYDPWRLPARQTENIALRFPRPDTPLGTSPNGLPTEDDSYFMTTEDGDGFLKP